MSGNGTLNAFAASTFGYDFVVIHSELFSNTYEKNKEALAFIVGHELGHLQARAHEAVVPAFDRLRRSGFPCSGISSLEPGSSPATGTAHTWRRGARKD